MATVGNLKIKISADSGGLRSGLQKAEKSLQKASRRMSAVGRDLSMTLTTSIGGLGFAAIDAAMDFEVLETQLSVLTGSAEQGAKAFKKIADFSAKTPFQLEDLVKANNTMMGFGMASDEAFQSLQMIGDAVAATGGDMDRIAVAYGQSIAANRVDARDILQFINNGIPIMEMLADVMGVNVSEVKELASQGKVTGEVLQAAFTKATSEGGKFAGATEKLAGTLRGVFSTVKDNIRLALGELGKDITESFDIKAIADKFVKSLQRVVAIFKSLSPEQKKFVIGMAAVLAAIGPILVALGSLAGLLGVILSPIGLVTTAILALSAGFVVAFKNSEKFRNVVAKVGAFLRTWFKMKIQQVRDFADIFKKVFKGDFSGAFESANKVLKGFTSSYTEAFKAARDASGDDIIDLDKLESNIKKAKDSVTDVFEPTKFKLPTGEDGESVFSQINKDYKKQSKELDNLRAAGLISEKDYNKQFEELQRNFLESLAKSGLAGTELYKQIADQYVRVRKETIQQIESIDSQFGGVGADMKKFLKGTADTAMKGGKQEGLISDYMLSKLTGIQVDQASKKGDHIGPVISKTQYDKIISLIESGISEGATLAAGGPELPNGLNKGYFIKPTIFTDVTNEMRIAKEEIFGPVLSIIPFDTEEEAVKIVNDTSYGLGNYLQTEDKVKAHRVAQKLRSGCVYINGHPADAGTPFGGYRQSGNGREGGVWGLEEYLEVKTVTGWK